MNEPWQTLSGIALGGTVVKILDRWFFARTKQTEIAVDAATKLREELFNEINGLRIEMREMQEAIERWRNRYYELKSIHSNVRTVLGVLRWEMQKMQAIVTGKPNPAVSEIIDSTIAVDARTMEAKADIAMRNLDAAVEAEEKAGAKTIDETTVTP